MREFVRIGIAICCLALPAATLSAATVNLQSITANASDYTFTYGGFLSPTEGVKFGSKLVIFDFAGYVDGSVSSVSPLVSASVAFSSPGFLFSPGVTDDPSLVNLIFTYIGSDFHTTPAPPGSPYSPISVSGLSARSIFGAADDDGFATLTVNNTGIRSVGTDVYSAGLVGVPVVPEPATWAMMIVGFGAAGFSMRRQRKVLLRCS